MCFCAPVWFDSDTNHTHEPDSFADECGSPLNPQGIPENQCFYSDRLWGQSSWVVNTVFLFQWRHTYRSVRMSRCLKRSLGSCCRLLFERDLKTKHEKTVIILSLSKSKFLVLKYTYFSFIRCGFLHSISSTMYSQMSQGFESSEGVLWESLDVIILNEPEDRTKHSHVTQWGQPLKFSQYYRMTCFFGKEIV